jgi:hypothetical protein
LRYEILTPPLQSIRAVPSSTLRRQLGLILIPFRPLGLSPNSRSWLRGEMSLPWSEGRFHARLMTVGPHWRTHQSPQVSMTLPPADRPRIYHGGRLL